MGEDKALLRLTPGGATMLECALTVARRISDDVIVVCPADRDYARFGATIAPDRFPGEGPFGGIITALEAIRSEQALILSCDHPFLSIPLLRWMSELPSTQLILPEVVAGDERRRFPIHARYRADLLPDLAALFATGERRLQRAIRQLDTRVIGPRAMLRFDPGLRSLINLNTPEDVAFFANRTLHQPGIPGSRQGSQRSDILNR